MMRYGASLARFFQVLVVLEGRTTAEVLNITGMRGRHVHTMVRFARLLGCVIVVRQADENRWHIVDPGPFDLRRLRQVNWGRLPERSM